MRSLIVSLLLSVFALPAFAYDITAVMPPTAGASTCTLYLDGVSVGGPRSCGTSQSYPNLITADGTYQFRYLTSNTAGDSALSPMRTVTISTPPPPVDPTDPPSITVECTPAPCPTSIVITITP